MKKTIKLNEAQLRNMIKEAIGEMALEQDDSLDALVSGPSFKEAISHLEIAMEALNKIDPSDFGIYFNEVDEKLGEIYDKVESATISLKMFKDFVISLFPRG